MASIGRSPAGPPSDPAIDADHGPAAGDEISLTLGDLGAGLLDAGYAVTDVQQALCAIGTAHGRGDLTIGVLPSAILVDDPRSGRTRLMNSSGAQLTFDQVAEVAEIARAAEVGPDGLGPIRERLAAVRARTPRLTRPIAVLGSGLMSAGIAVVFRTTWWAVALDFAARLREYVEVMRCHIEVEEDVFFDTAQHYLTDHDRQELTEEFEAVHWDEIEEGVASYWEDLAHRLWVAETQSA